ncbi:Mak16 protein like protein [Aduncisulcus paluster]|uniref:Protein MAK16 homolog n=1 Tax=Aduncisulcus paluster TaxID=2918883 RepID=A0ABQ5KKN9_9EUKA|nr:Mak16 protein like protein [Aduncisulcus paluster]
MSDDEIWRVIGSHFCSFRVGGKPKDFCKNEYNLTGRCQRKFCPLANGQIATVLDDKGKIYLAIKTVERAHFPCRQWEKILLKKDMVEATKQIDDELQYWPDHIVTAVKDRLERILEIHETTRKLEKEKKKLLSVNQKFERREKKLLKEARRKARLDRTVQKELLLRLSSGQYADLYQRHGQAFKKAIAKKTKDIEDILEPEVAEEKEVEQEMELEK